MSAFSNVLFSGKLVIDSDSFVDLIDAACVFTCKILVVIALLQSYKQFNGEAIDCLTPDSMSFGGSEEVC